jgi:hypothetical protein
LYVADVDGEIQHAGRHGLITVIAQTRHP